LSVQIYDLPTANNSANTSYGMKCSIGVFWLMKIWSYFLQILTIRK